PNDETIKYVCERTGKTKDQLNIKKSDKDADYVKEYHFDIDGLEEQISCPNDVDNVKGISKVQGTSIDQAVIGSCTNGRLNDLKVAAEILEGHKVHEDVRLIILPASREIYLNAINKGYIQTFIDAGAIVCNPGCGPCLGAHMGVLCEGETAISTTNRNFKGRMGDPKSSVYLSNPKVVAASAIKGFIEKPENI
ncbi:MAG: aconitase family protein, partial [Methanobrevibacter wolinii]